MMTMNAASVRAFDHGVEKASGNHREPEHWKDVAQHERDARAQTNRTRR